MKWRSNIEAVYKGKSRLYFLRKTAKMLLIFLKSVTDSAGFSNFHFADICLGSSIRASDLKITIKLIKKAGSELGTALEPLERMVQRRMLQKLPEIKRKKTTIPLHNAVIKPLSVFRQRLLQLCCNKEQHRRPCMHTELSYTTTVYNDYYCLFIDTTTTRE